MKTIVAILVTSTLLVGGVHAQSPATTASDAPAADPSHHAVKSDAERNNDVEKHIADLHVSLKITPTEESLWSATAQTMRDNADELDKAIDKREAASGTAIDDLNTYGAVVQAHADGIKKLSAVFTPLYASMSADQKNIADEVFAQRGHEGKNHQALK